MQMGLPRVLLSDNGSEFCNALNDQLSEMLGIKRRLTTPYHSQVCSMNVIVYCSIHLKMRAHNLMSSDLSQLVFKEGNAESLPRHLCLRI